MEDKFEYEIDKEVLNYAIKNDPCFNNLSKKDLENIIEGVINRLLNENLSSEDIKNNISLIDTINIIISDRIKELNKLQSELLQLSRDTIEMNN